MSTHLAVAAQGRGPALWRWAMNALIASAWVAVCAMTPEFIWRGARIVVRHFSWGDAISALFIGLILAFCIEPAMERLRHMLSRPTQGRIDHTRVHKPLFAAAMGLAFALASVCLHDAITAFLAANSDDHLTRSRGLVTGIRIACAWAMVPFLISLAWLSADRRPLGIPCGILGALSPILAGFLFSWSVQDVVSTELPCLIILALGYREGTAPRNGTPFLRCARIIAWVAPLWLIFAVCLDYVFLLLNLKQFILYTRAELWIDARFYLGWAIGLMLAPFPGMPSDHTKAGPAHRP